MRQRPHSPSATASTSAVTRTPSCTDSSRTSRSSSDPSLTATSPSPIGSATAIARLLLAHLAGTVHEVAHVHAERGMLDGHDRRFYAPAAGRSPSALRAWSKSERGASTALARSDPRGIGEERRSRGAEVVGEPRAGRVRRRARSARVRRRRGGAAVPPRPSASFANAVARGDPGRERARGLHVAAARAEVACRGDELVPRGIRRPLAAPRSGASRVEPLARAEHRGQRAAGAPR